MTYYQALIELRKIYGDPLLDLALKARLKDVIEVIEDHVKVERNMYCYEQGRDQGKTDAVKVLQWMKDEAEKTPHCGLKADALLANAMEEIERRWRR